MFANRLVKDMVKPAVTDVQFDGQTVTFTTRPIADPLTQMPVVRARATNPADLLPGYQLALDVVVDVWAKDETTAHDVSMAVYDRLLRLQRTQERVADGWIRRFACPVYPGLVEDPAMPEGVVRYLANYDLVVRHD